MRGGGGGPLGEQTGLDNRTRESESRRRVRGRRRRPCAVARAARAGALPGRSRRARAPSDTIPAWDFGTRARWIRALACSAFGGGSVARTLRPVCCLRALCAVAAARERKPGLGALVTQLGRIGAAGAVTAVRLLPRRLATAGARLGMPLT